MQVGRRARLTLDLHGTFQGRLLLDTLDQGSHPLSYHASLKLTGAAFKPLFPDLYFYSLPYRVSFLGAIEGPHKRATP